VPVGAKTVTPAIPDPKHEPGKCSERQGDKIGESPSGYEPAENIKQDKDRVKPKKEEVNNFQQGFRHEVIYL